MKYILSTTLLFSLMFCILFSSPFGLLDIIYTESIKSWTIGSPMPTPRTEVAGTSIGNNIYVIGGLDSSGRVLNTVEVYNIDNSSWKSVAPLPQPLHHTAASSFNNKIYVVGGYSTSIANWVPSDKLFIYDPPLDKWVEGKYMPTARGAMTANFVDGIMFVIGGYGSSKILDINEAYNPLTNDWEFNKTLMPTPRHHAASTVVDDKLFIIGGRIVGLYPIVNSNLNERYDPKEDKWRTLESMPFKRSGISSASINGSIYVFGGEDVIKTFNNNEKYDVKSNKWISLEPLPTARHGLAAVSINDTIFVIGGGPKSGLSVTNVNEIFNVE